MLLHLYYTNPCENFLGWVAIPLPRHNTACLCWHKILWTFICWAAFLLSVSRILTIMMDFSMPNRHFPFSKKNVHLLHCLSYDFLAVYNFSQWEGTIYFLWDMSYSLGKLYRNLELYSVYIDLILIFQLSAHIG